MGFEMQVGNRKYDFEPNNCVINLFRNNSDFDYVAYHMGKNEYIALFDPAVCHWLGGVALTPDDQKSLRAAERNLGSYRERFGANPRVIIDDDPDESEVDLRVKGLIGDEMDEIHDLLRLNDGES